MPGVKIVDLTLRDGMHSVKHQFSAGQMAELAKQIDTIGVDMIEFGHGNGLGGSSLQYGFAKATDEEYMDAVCKAVGNTPLCCITIPGIGTRHELQMALDHGIKTARFATQMTECDIARQHIGLAKEMGMQAYSVLPVAKPLSVKDTAYFASEAEKYGADAVYLLDGSGTMLPDDVYDRVAAMRKVLDVEIGFHGHNNLQLAVANSLAAVDAGATLIDCCVKGFGAGAGNCSIEPFIVALEKKGIKTNADLYKAMDVGDKYLKPLMPNPIELTSDQIMLGASGTYSSFLLFARRAADKFGVDARDVIGEIGERGCTEGQEQMCIEVAYELSRSKV